MSSYKADFIKFVIDHQILRFGSFTLKSGRTSPYFFNAGLFNTGDKLAFLANAYAGAIVDAQVGVDVLFGPAYKGIPLVSATAIALSANHGKNLPWCFNRKEAKDHGEGGTIVGSPLAGRVLIIDDVITAGTAIREAADIIEAQGAQLSGIVVAMDRQEKGVGSLSAIEEVEESFGITIANIINLDDIVDYLQQENDTVLSEHLDAVVKYRETYGVE